MNKKVIGAVAVVAFFAGCGCQQNKDETTTNNTQPSDNAVAYTCDGEMIKVDFNNEAEPKTATIYVESKGESITLPNVESGSGAKYSDEEFTFWTHQNEATVSIAGTDKTLHCKRESDNTEDVNTIIDDNGNTVTEGCKTWFDGCNNCQVSPEGILACTRKYCDPTTLQEAKCLDEDAIDEAKQKCAEVGGKWDETQNSCFEDPATMAGPGE
jgi:membrane-bound inhibitor of C-type lysozyme